MAEQSKLIDFTSIIVVDDNLLFVREVAFLLKVVGFEVFTAGDAATALDQIRRRTPDVIFADADMPGISGCDLLRQVRSTPAWRSIPVILTSCHYEMDDLLRALDLGADEFLPKPFDIYDLLDAVKQVLVPRPFDEVYREAVG